MKTTDSTDENVTRQEVGAVFEAVDLLSPGLKQVINLAFKGIKTEEIATIMGIPAERVAAYKQEAVELLEKYVIKTDENETDQHI